MQFPNIPNGFRYIIFSFAGVWVFDEAVLDHFDMVSNVHCMSHNTGIPHHPVGNVPKMLFRRWDT